MNDPKLVKVFHSSNDLVKELLRFGLFHSLVLNNVVKKLTPACIFHDQVKLFRGLYDLIELYNVRMSNQLQDVNLSRHPLNIAHILNFLLLEDLDGHFLSCEVVAAELDLSEGALSNRFA
jgi:hypothetical protein